METHGVEHAVRAERAGQAEYAERAVRAGHAEYAGHAGHAAGRGAGHGRAGHDHAEHGHAAGATAGRGGTSWRMAAQATLHCLTGCAVGEVLGMMVGTAAGLANGATIALSIVLAFAFGYALTMRGVLRTGLSTRQALKIALAADTVSIAVMEVIDNTVIVGIPGAMDAGLADALFWLSLAASLALAFLVTTPVNRLMISRGRGHAVVHAHH